ncbi:MAG: AAA family ATPase [Dysgonamonadaceae bacterium]|jgi:hypothetical protein|nr:AAA family ATPase [Dysgonamonadaceae bacterium]
MFDKKEYNRIINLGEKSSYIEENKGTVNNTTIVQAKPSFSKEELLSNINQASVDLSLYENTFQGKKHIDRKETTEIFNWIEKELQDKESNIALLVGNAGYGKSVVLKDLFDLLRLNNIPVLGIKADKILNIGSLNDIETELNLHDNILSIFQSLSANYSSMVLLIDQIDALSQSLSSNRNAINLYDRLIKQLENYPNVRIVISCRTYDLDYDPTLRSYKGKNIFRISLLEIEQVYNVLSEIGIAINDNNERLKEFLRVPLHLNLFCKVGLNKQFDDNITLQKLYDEIWSEYIENGSGVESSKVIELLTLIADKMHKQQHIVVDKRSFNHQYSKEINSLLHSDLIKETDNKIQFIHQTFFDYVYARTFIASGQSISNSLKEIHQGLFIRSQVKQIFSYLRDLDVETYMRELKTVLLGNGYRFHLQLLLINDLGFYQNPLKQEVKFVKDHIISSSLLVRIFLESVQSAEWFKFIIEENEFEKLLSTADDETEFVIINLCVRIIWQDAQVVIDFLTKHLNKIKLIENVLTQIPDKDVALSYELYNKTSDEWNGAFGRKCYYLEKVLKSDPDFVIAELKKDFDKNISLCNEDWLQEDYIPRGHYGLHTYGELYKLYPYKAIPYFLYVIEQAAEIKQYALLHGLYGDATFYLYRPNPENNTDCHEFKDIYDLTLSGIKNNSYDIQSKELFINLLDSKLANLCAIGIYYLLQNINEEINRIFSIFTKDNFFISIDSSEILKYYSKELLAISYPLFTAEQQQEVNQAILCTKNDFYHWTHEDYYTKKKLRSNYLRHTYSLISMLSEKCRNEHKEIRKIYQEGFRKYGKVVNDKPQKVSMMSGDRSYSTNAYEKMSFNDWKNTFKKLKTESRSIDDWKKPSKRGNERQFEEYVSKNPDTFYPFITELIDDKDIILDYVLAGLEGLKKGDYCKSNIQCLCLSIINHREKELNESNLVTFLRALECITQDNKDLNKSLFDFIKEVIYEYPDRESKNDSDIQRDIGMDAVQVGINSIRGVAVRCLVGCHSLLSYKDEIFETLEFVADNANEVTRSCAIFNAAWLNNMDKQRAFDLYLRMVQDYNPLLLAIPFHDGHPLLYHIHIDYDKLVPFFTKAITIEEAGRPMSFFLFNAYLNDKPNALDLLKTLLKNNTQSREKLLWNTCTHFLKNEKHSEKGWIIIDYLLDFDDKELGKTFNSCFLHIPAKIDDNLKLFLGKYINSPISQYKDNYFYDFLRKLIVFDANLCLEYFFDSQPNDIKYDFYDKSPLNVLIEAYNGIREYEKENPILEKAMDTFDSLLYIPQYRNVHLRTFLKELSS